MIFGKEELELMADKVNNEYFRGYIYQSKKPGNVPSSYAIYYKEVDSSGKTIKVYKDTYDNKGHLVHRKNK